MIGNTTPLLYTLYLDAARITDEGNYLTLRDENVHASWVPISDTEESCTRLPLCPKIY